MTAGRSGNVGIVFYAPSNDSLNELIQNGTDPPYIIVMSAELFEAYVVYERSNSDSSNNNNNESNVQQQHFIVHLQQQLLVHVVS